MDPSTALPEVLNTIDLAPLLNLILAFLAAVLTAVLGLAGRWLNKKTGIEVDLKNNAILDAAIDRGLEYARTKIADKSHISVKNDITRLAVSYAISGAPKALAYFKITPDRLTEMIESRMRPDDLPEVM